MANYLESSNVPLAPYTPSVDLNLLDRTLRTKQGQYDSNVSRIQSTLDNASGLDVYRPIDKEYLQNKVKDVTSELNSLAGTDFSNNSIVNQAMGLSSKIYKDPNIQSAIMSTQGIKTLMSDQKTLKEKHPELYSPENEWYDTQEVNRYLNSQDLSDSYKGPKAATRYFDANTPIKEALDELGPTVSYKINSDGKFQYFIDKESKVRPAEIENLVNGIIARDPRIQKQLDISGAYTYRNENPISFYRHINNFYDTQLQQNNALKAFYIAKKAEDPTNPIVQKQVDAFLSDTEHNITKLQADKSKYINYFTSGQDFNKIKQTFFNDELRKSYVTNYQQDDHELEIKANQSAIQSQDDAFKAANIGIAQAHLGIAGKELEMKMIAAGQNPVTGAAITIDDPYYQSFVNANIKSFNPDGSFSTGSGNKAMQSLGLYSSVGGITPDKYDQVQNQSRIKQADDNLYNASEDLKKNYAQLNPDLELGSKYFNDAFVGFVKEQEKHIANGDGQVNSTYLRYKNRVQDDLIYKSSLENLDKSIVNQAIKEHPFAGLNEKISVDGLNIKYPDGSIKRKLEFTPAQNQEFVTKYKIFKTEVENKLKESLGDQYLDATTGGNETKKIIQDIADHYKNDPDYPILRAIADGGINKFAEASKKIVQPLDNLLSKRQKTIDSLYEVKGQTLTYPSTIISGKAEVEKQYQKLAASAIKEATPGKKIEIDVDKIKPIDTYQDENGNQYLRYNDLSSNKKDDIQTIKIPSQANTFGRPDPFYRLEQAIDKSPNNMTPDKGVGVRVTTNGKIRHVIAKGYGPNAGYSVYVLDDSGNKIPIDPGIDQNGRARQEYPNLSSANKALEDLSIMVDPATKNKLSPADIIEWARKNYKKY